MKHCHLGRRELLLSGAALALAEPALARASKPAKPGFAGLLDRFADEILQLSPETATNLGLDKGARAALKYKLSDDSPAAETRWNTQMKSMRLRLAAVDRNKLSEAEKTQYDTVAYAVDRGIEGGKIRYDGAASGFFGGASPYVVTQQSGALSGIPEFLDAQHSIKSASDAEAYLSRMSQLARLLDQESHWVKDRAAQGVIPPSFVLSNALGQLKGFRATKAADQRMVSSLADRARAANIAGNWAARAEAIIAKQIYPALDRQIAAISTTAKTANDTAGVHKLPDGEAYYRWALQLGTTTTTPPEEVHKIGLEQNQAIQSRMDAILKAQGMTNGTVGERVLALTRDPKMLYANDDKGRAELITFINGRVDAIRKLLPSMSKLGLKADLVVKRVPADIQDGASLGYMNFASLDGSRPAIYYINLKSTSLWPRYQLTTLTAHEGVPGHTWQGAYLAEHHKDIPLMFSLMGFNAFVEGWALYSEQLVDEHGLYADDPFSQLGYLQAQQFRACRLVVDTGLHAMKWTRQQSVDFLVQNTGRGVDAMTSETDRYCVSPGQACGYKMGHNEILRLRAKASADLGSAYDERDFNDVVVSTGGVPLAVLANVVDRYIASKKG